LLSVRVGQSLGDRAGRGFSGLRKIDESCGVCATIVDSVLDCGAVGGGSAYEALNQSKPRASAGTMETMASGAFPENSGWGADFRKEGVSSCSQSEGDLSDRARADRRGLGLLRYAEHYAAIRDYSYLWRRVAPIAKPGSVLLCVVEEAEAEVCGVG
jgi:hypothetical protein